MKKILIIKHGAFGDIIKALPTLYSIHTYYKDAQISLLTSPQYTQLHQTFFSYCQIFEDKRNKNIFQTLDLLRKIKACQFDLIIDLQNSKRSNRYFYILKYLLNNQSLWSGTAYTCPFYLPFSIKKQIHLNERYNKQLKQLRIEPLTYLPEFNNHLTIPITLPLAYALIIPGCSAASPEKKWSIEHFLTIVQFLQQKNVKAVFIGGPEELELSSIINKECFTAINLINQLSYKDIIAIAIQSKIIIGNDTGPLYLAQLSGRPTCVLWSNHSNYLLHGPKSNNVHIIQKNNINDISPKQVIEILMSYIS